MGCVRTHSSASSLARARACLGAEAFATFEITQRGRLRLLESVGELPAGETAILRPLAAGSRYSEPEQVVFERLERFLLARKGTWLLAVRFRDESSTKESWRKDFIRFLAHQFFVPVRNLEDLSSAEASRALALARGNKRRTALLLGISPGTLYKLLNRRGAPKR